MDGSTTSTHPHLMTAEGKEKSESEITPITDDLPRPPMSDFLDIRSTIPGYVSVRKKLTLHDSPLLYN